MLEIFAKGFWTRPRAAVFLMVGSPAVIVPLAAWLTNLVATLPPHSIILAALSGVLILAPLPVVLGWIFGHGLRKIEKEFQDDHFYEIVQTVDLVSKLLYFSLFLLLLSIVAFSGRLFSVPLSIAEIGAYFTLYSYVLTNLTGFTTFESQSPPLLLSRLCFLSALGGDNSRATLADKGIYYFNQFWWRKERLAVKLDPPLSVYLRLQSDVGLSIRDMIGALEKSDYPKFVNVIANAIHRPNVDIVRKISLGSILKRMTIALVWLIGFILSIYTLLTLARGFFGLPPK